MADQPPGHGKFFIYLNILIQSDAAQQTFSGLILLYLTICGLYQLVQTLGVDRVEGVFKRQRWHIVFSNNFKLFNRPITFNLFISIFFFSFSVFSLRVFALFLL